jgi:hypothetical protein
VKTRKGPQTLLDRVTPTQHQVRPARAERVAELCERFQEEGDAVGCAERLEDGVVDDEERHDSLGALDRRRECGVVVHAEISCEEDDHRGRAGALPHA